ncbi:MAG TPA: hypothetical protein VM686_11585 [Polyangiaceae bacterium]|nr:hypothetical protein [Polyangiaceae bacterium]
MLQLDMSDDVARAVKLCRLGVSMAEAARLTGVSLAALRKGKKTLQPSVTRDDLILAALTENGTRPEGTLPALDGLAAWIDHMNHDGTTAGELERDLLRLTADGLIAVENGRYRLLRPWP